MVDWRPVPQVKDRMKVMVRVRCYFTKSWLGGSAEVGQMNDSQFNVLNDELHQACACACVCVINVYLL